MLAGQDGERQQLPAPVSVKHLGSRWVLRGGKGQGCHKQARVQSTQKPKLGSSTKGRASGSAGAAEQHGHPSSPRTDRARRTRSCGLMKRGVKHRKYLANDFTKDLLTGLTSSLCSLGPTFSAPVAAERRNNAAALPELPRGGEERSGAARPGPERHAVTHLPGDFQAAFNRSASVPEGGRASINEAR